MHPKDYYNQNLKKWYGSLILLQNKNKLFAWARLLNGIGIITIIYLLWTFSWIYILSAAIILIIIFVRLIILDNENKYNIKHTQHLININEDELKILNFNYHHLESGLEHLPSNHNYANDLDIFGKASIFQYINRTSSQLGSQTLADWLLAPTSFKNILKKQDAIKELATKIEFIQHFQAYGKEKKILSNTKNKLNEWILQPIFFTKNKIWLLLSYLIPTLIIAAIILNYFDIISNYLRNYFLLAATISSAFFTKKINPVHQQVSKIADELGVLTNLIKLVEQEFFENELLKQLQNQFLINNYKASTQLKKLKKILDNLDLKSNPLVFIPLNIIFQWDLQQGIALEKWKNINSNKIIEWFNAIAQFEAFNSFATLLFNNPNWCFPNIKNNFFSIEGEEIGHPLINNTKRINNSICINKSGELMLITGSNMAGKSTYLRSIGVNVVLAMAGAPVCAATFTMSPISLISSMRIADNLDENTSTFYAELKKLKLIIDKVNAKENIFILLDEILRGTNSLDRHTGSKALIKQMINCKAACVIATHDIELANLKNTYPTNILNFHFDAQVKNEELFFDYKLKTGICTSLNASILMKKIGIEIN